MTAVDRIADLARRLTPLTDPAGPDRLAALLADAGWTSIGTNAFTVGELTAWADDDGIRVDLPDFGHPDDLDPDDFDTVDAWTTARQQLYDSAVATMHRLAGMLDLLPAGPFDLEEREYHQDQVRLRAGHWAVHLVATADDDDSPILVEVMFAYGADLPGRLAQLAGPPSGRRTVDWDLVTARTGVTLPADHRWLVENYGTEPIGGGFVLHDPESLGKPVPGPLLPGRDPHQLLPVAVTAEGDEVAYRLGWEITGLRIGDREIRTGLLHHVVVTLAGR